LRKCSLLVLLLSTQLFCQVPKSDQPAHITELQRIQQAALHSDYAYQFAAHLTDNIGPRLSGSLQYDAAARWVADEFRRLGLDVRMEKVMVPHWVRGEETGELVQFPAMAPNTTQKLALTALGDSVATPKEGITAEVVVVRDFDELHALSRDQVQGKIVLFNESFDTRLAEAGEARQSYGEAVQYRAAAPTEAASAGAIATFVRSVGGAEYRLPHTGGTYYKPGIPRIPAAALSAEDAELIARLAKQGPVRIHFVLTPQDLPETEAFNIIGDLKGSERPEEIVILSGHLDSWDLGTGAIDDAAGLSQAIDAVRIIKELGLKPRRTIRVIAWANEENGVRGGRGYARDHQNELANHQAAIESDLGPGHPLGIFYDGDPSMEKVMGPAMSVLRLQGAGVLRPNETGTDIIPISVAGVPTFDPIQDARTYFNYHHSAADTLDKINPETNRENTALLAVLGYFLANLDQKLPHHPKPMPVWMQEEEQSLRTK
jgi:Zn-dependent M28 family amino/carboxypeptidase